MNDSPLTCLQERMAKAVMRPLTRNETMQKRDENGASVSAEAGAFIKPNDRLTSFERLEIYNRQYWFRLFSAFEEDFPGLKSIVGTRRFESLMRAYLEAHPSRSFTLRNLGSSLVEWLKKNSSYAAPRSDVAIAMAELEWAHIESFDNGSRPSLTLEEIGTLNGNSKIDLQPYLKLMNSLYAVDDALLVIRDSNHAEASQASNAVGIHLVRKSRAVGSPKRQQIYLAIHRHDEMVYYKRLDREDYLLLCAFEDGATIDQAIEVAFGESSIPESDRPAYIQSAFQHFMHMRWLCPHREESA